LAEFGDQVDSFTEELAMAFEAFDIDVLDEEIISGLGFL
jgi:hypothetical protein